MYRFRSRPQRRQRRRWPWLAVGSCLCACLFAALAIVISKKSVESDDREISDGLIIKFNRTSPPFAALEDSISRFDDVDSVSKQDSIATSPVVTLAAGQKSFANSAAALIASNLEIQRTRELTEARIIQAAQGAADALAASQKYDQKSDVDDRVAIAHMNAADANATVPMSASAGQLPQATVAATVAATTVSAVAAGQAVGNIATVGTDRSVGAVKVFVSKTKAYEDEVIGADPDSMIVSDGKILPLTAEIARNIRVMSAASRAPENATETPIESYQHPTRHINLAELKIDRAELMKSLFFPMVTAGHPTVQEPSHAIANNKSRGNSERVGGLQPRGTHAPTGFGSEESRHSLVPRSVASENPFSVKGHERSEELSNRLSVATVAESMSQVVVSGPLELAGGLAYTSPSDQIVVYREFEDEVAESGHVWFRDGRYEIFVGRTEGLLVAELRTAAGDVLGRGSVEFAQLPKIAKNQYRVDPVAIRMTPVIRGLRGQARSAYSYGSKVEVVPAAEIIVDESGESIVSEKDGRFHDSEMAAGSSVIVRSSKAGYWGSLGFAMTGIENEVLLFPDKMMTAFTDLVASSSRTALTPESFGSAASVSQKSAIVWGRVTKNGMPVVGAKVEMLTGQEELRPVYFNSVMIPDPALTETTANGVYAFFPVEPGVHAVQAEFGGQRTESVLFPTEERFVTSLDLEMARSRKANVRVFDAFHPDAPITAKVTAVGEEQSFTIDSANEKTYSYAAGSGPLIFDIDAGDKHAITRLSVPRDRRSILIPMISQSWIDQVRNYRRLNKENDSGVVVGFIQANSPYQVVPAGEVRSSTVRVVYFDEQGRLIQGDTGVPGGGYIIFNIPQGFSTVSIVPIRKGPVQTVTVLVDKRVVNVVNHVLR